MINTNSEFEICAVYNYAQDTHVTPQGIKQELKLITYINRLLREDNSANHRLILNHIITISNVFGSRAAARLILYKISTKKHIMVNTYLYFLGYHDTKNINDSLLTILQKI